MKRREFTHAAFLAGLAGSSLASPGAHSLSEKPDDKMGRTIPWQNWSGSQKAYPEQRLSPRTEEELADFLKQSSRTVRPVGAGHSFTPLVPTDGTILSTRRFNQVKDIGQFRTEVGAGAKLNQLGEPLHQLGQALPNMPDIDEQTIGGALSTGTHGTGSQFGAMHSYVEALRLVTPRGDILDCSRQSHPDIFDAARVSIGSLGVITQYTLRNVAPYKLKLRKWMQPFEQALQDFHHLARSHRNFEMYYIPHCDNALMITTDESDDDITPRGADTDNDSAQDLKMLRDYASWSPWLRKKLLNAVSDRIEPEESVDWWWNIYPSDRAVRFNEMEYHLPLEHLVDALRQVRDKIEKDNPDVFFPVEVRVVREDDAWLSPFYRRPTASLATHRYYLEDYPSFFKTIEPIYQSMEGRPHWGKLHTLDGSVFKQRYPRWEDFQAIRRELDPKGIMLNDHLKKVFEHG